ncbi:MAG: hypothetical protein Ct9H300mP1_28130 [Planctomycetaceae bacterium]|nr:MAG: hypothetical protein Ct9H300mP1_28130 [Planctomycetaceae bacterium]
MTVRLGACLWMWLTLPPMVVGAEPVKVSGPERLVPIGTFRPSVGLGPVRVVPGQSRLSRDFWPTLSHALGPG